MSPCLRPLRSLDPAHRGAGIQPAPRLSSTARLSEPASPSPALSRPAWKSLSRRTDDAHARQTPQRSISQLHHPPAPTGCRPERHTLVRESVFPPATRQPTRPKSMQSSTYTPCQRPRAAMKDIRARGLPRSCCSKDIEIANSLDKFGAAIELQDAAKSLHSFRRADVPSATAETRTPPYRLLHHLMTSS